MTSLINKAILYQYATEVVLIILCLVLSVFAVIDIRKIKQIYLYLKVWIKDSTNSYSNLLKILTKWIESEYTKQEEQIYFWALARILDIHSNTQIQSKDSLKNRKNWHFKLQNWATIIPQI